ncbi:MAG TPA: chemotaxis response regulator protein-glutamate methylesterase [Candidatus Acidoferrales bacterium]|nr:chemotaxis response regulator protein-glutamate methylesterase [Candidatus Acidoferrales bacterium]
MTPRIRVVVVDDSALMRKLIPRLLESDPSIEVVGTAMDGAIALRKIEELRPDVLTLDLEMPLMDGIATLRAIMRARRLPVIVFSAHSHRGANLTFKALGLGAFDFVTKPAEGTREALSEAARELAVKIKAAAGTQLPNLPPSELPDVPPAKAEEDDAPRHAPARVIAVGVSTGGPAALQRVIPQLPAGFPGCILIVQHMPEGFTDMFARRLDECSAIRVREARSGDYLMAGHAFVCPGNRHMTVRRMVVGDLVVLRDSERVNGHRPSADVLLTSVAQEFGAAAAGVIMTGMGDDGVEGLGRMREAGGITLAQSRESCVVDSMPRMAIERRYAQRVVPLEAMGKVWEEICAAERVPAD